LVDQVSYNNNEQTGAVVPQHWSPPVVATMAMQTTKSQILGLLKRSGGSTVEELASALNLARMTVRQHLATLERDDLVSAREVRRATGRPHFLYTLTDKGEETFPKRYDRLADMIIDEVALLDGGEIEGLSPTEKKDLLFRKLAQRLALQYAPRVEGKGLEERVQTVTEILQSESGFAEWRKVDSGFEILDYNCAYRKVAENQDLCAWHLELLTRLLGGPVRAVSFQSKGGDLCRFVVERVESRAQEQEVAE
jgi:predicted ArsR family transcriptional regulator